MLCEALGVELEQLAAVDREGRALITDHGPFLLVNLYGALWRSCTSGCN
jgi:hypothetical protein